MSIVPWARVGRVTGVTNGLNAVTCTFDRLNQALIIKLSRNRPPRALRYPLPG